MLRLAAVVFDANGHRALGRFWADALGWDLAEEGDRVVVTGGAHTLRRLEIVDRPNVKSGPSWLHFDLSSTEERRQADTVERLLGLGARHVDIGQGPDAAHVVLADPEGNELCVLTEGNGFVESGELLGSITCNGSPATGSFWAAALGWPLIWDQDEETATRPPDGGQFFTFGPPVAEKATKNRAHVHLRCAPGDDLATEVDRLLGLGATPVDIGQGDVPWIVLADPDGNELCVLPPDRGDARRRQTVQPS